MKSSYLHAHFFLSCCMQGIKSSCGGSLTERLRAQLDAAAKICSPSAYAKTRAAETFTVSSPAVMEFWGQNVDVFISRRLMVLRAVALFSFSGGREQIDFSFLFENPFCAELERQPCVKNAHFSLFFPAHRLLHLHFCPFFSNVNIFVRRRKNWTILPARSRCWSRRRRSWRCRWRQ